MVLTKSTFLTYAGKTDYLGCVIGHELSHIVFNDHIEQSIKLSENLKEIKEKNNTEILINSEKIKGNDEKDQDKEDDIKEVLKLELSRETEMIADHNGTKMMINAGFAKETCLNEMTFIAKQSQWGSRHRLRKYTP